MKRSMMATKLYVPAPRRGFVARPRLREKLRLGSDSGLTLVSAPAGFGKTALLADWLGDATVQERRVAWLSLDAGDGEPATFWSGVITSLQSAVPGVGSTALELIGSSPLATELVLTTLVNDLAAAPQDVWLVLDDYHTVDSQAVGTGLAYFLENLPPQVHVVVSTRSDPDLPLSRWRVRGELAEIRAADLRFTPDETAAYLNGVAGLDLAAEQVNTLDQRTEGWIAALQLAALSLRDREDAAAFIERFAGDHRYIVDYLVEEVLEHQPDAVRSFLLHTALLDRLTGPLCDAVTGRDDGGTMLLTLERANLFVVPLDDQREWYRYHHLFADVLRGRLLSEEPAQVPLLHRRASHWYESHGHVEDAVRHALAGQDFDRAAHLAELAVPMLRRSRQDAVLFGWLKALPDAAIRRSPLLNVFYGGMLMASGDLAGVEQRLDDADRALAEAQRPAAGAAAAGLEGAETQELQMLPATIAMYRASLAQARGDVAGTSAHARRALDMAGPDHHFARGAAAAFLGLAAWADGDVLGALETFTQAVASLRAAGNLLDELSSTVILADMWLAAGRPGEARRICGNALRQADARGDSMMRASAELQVALSEICRQAGDLSDANRHLETASAFVEKGPMTESRYRWFVASALVAQDEGPDLALSYLDQAAELFRPGFFPDVRPIPAIKARVWVRQGNLSEAASWARAAGLSVRDDASYMQEYSHLTLVRLLIAQQHAHPDTNAAAGAVDLLDRLLASATDSGRGGSVVEIRMLQALAHDVLGHRRQALEALGAAFAGSPEPDEYVRLFLDEGPPMIELLREAASEAMHDAPDTATHDAAAAAHAQRLLTLGAPSEPQPPRPAERPPSDVDPLSERELQVLRLLDSELSGPEIARALFISHNTVRTHTKHIFTKLGVTSRRAAVSRARDRGLM
ncbi:LuxR C-terminal-related transcriptional regulator [Pseudarthrobacter sulfonivorans]|uniref:LuxR C-terminal-related transcriptional regulator n=1 Tax=Pseudarthrobacter sulfonivorans TaxID=121292 RepID=UPI002861CA41|nr:LuxR C-terminal-related transcriptional regulator [Pseudarthrobacter sulfonivorans]MDR6414971.1 LuxR family maltose regulon positive regulatory protein [Pseudarthrobacter sulfonivorans]